MIMISKRRNKKVIAICIIVLVVSFLFSISMGYSRLLPADIIRAVLGKGSDKQIFILLKLRVPRVVLSMLIGAGLGMSGCLVQGISRNPLADPGLLGINSGAGMMVILFITLFGGNWVSPFFLPAFAFSGGAMAVVMIYTLAYKKSEGLQPMVFLLTGLGVQAGISACTMLFVICLDETQFDFAARWQSGSIWSSSWKFVIILCPWMIAFLIYSLTLASELDLFQIGNETAIGLGVDMKKKQRQILMAAAAMAAASAAVGGNIGFAGLISSHIGRRLVGPNHLVLIPVSGLIGAILVSAADTVGRIILQPVQIPAGIVSAAIGAPFFLYLLSKKRNQKGVWE